MNASAIESLYATGKWFLDQGDPLKAVDIFRVLVLVASSDERGWLGIGACHDALGQQAVALDLYTLGAEASKSARCHIARARLFKALSRDEDADAALDAAEMALASIVDADAEELLLHERRLS
jgi:hypothetical protein